MVRDSKTHEQADRRHACDAAAMSNSRTLDDQQITRLEDVSRRKTRRHVFPTVSLTYRSNKAFHYSPKVNHPSWSTFQYQQQI